MFSLASPRSGEPLAVRPRVNASDPAAGARAADYISKPSKLSLDPANNPKLLTSFATWTSRTLMTGWRPIPQKNDAVLPSRRFRLIAEVYRLDRRRSSALRDSGMI